MIRVSVHVFIDESKRSGYMVVAAVVASQNLDGTRRQLRGLLLPGQRELHFKKENDGRRRYLLGQLTGLPVTARIYLRRSSDHVQARRACLEAAVQDLHQAERIVLDMAEGEMAADRRTLFESRHKTGADFTYHHLKPRQEPLLWIPDGIAWAWSHTGPWRASVQPLVTDVRHV